MALAAVRVAVHVPPANRGYGRAHAMTVPRGWTAEVWALVPGARLESWTPEGDLLVSQPFAGTIAERLPRARRSEPPLRRTIVSTNPQGMAFDRLGGHEVLYVAESDQFDRYESRGHGVGTRTAVIPNLPDGGAHPLKNVVVGPDHTVYIDIGSATNASPPDAGAGVPRDSVLAYQPAAKRVRVPAPVSATATACRSRLTARSGRPSTSATASPTRFTARTADRPTPTVR